MRTFVLAELPELALDSPTCTEAHNQLAEAEGAPKLRRDGGSYQVVSH